MAKAGALAAEAQRDANLRPLRAPARLAFGLALGLGLVVLRTAPAFAGVRWAGGSRVRSASRAVIVPAAGDEAAVRRELLRLDGRVVRELSDPGAFEAELPFASLGALRRHRGVLSVTPIAAPAGVPAFPAD